MVKSLLLEFFREILILWYKNFVLDCDCSTKTSDQIININLATNRPTQNSHYGYWEKQFAAQQCIKLPHTTGEGFLPFRGLVPNSVIA